MPNADGPQQAPLTIREIRKLRDYIMPDPGKPVSIPIRVDIELAGVDMRADFRAQPERLRETLREQYDMDAETCGIRDLGTVMERVGETAAAQAIEEAIREADSKALGRLLVFERFAREGGLSFAGNDDVVAATRHFVDGFVRTLRWEKERIAAEARRIAIERIRSETPGLTGRLLDTVERWATEKLHGEETRTPDTPSL